MAKYGPAPPWALAIVDEVTKAAGVVPPTVNWRERKRDRWSGGRTGMMGRVVWVEAGTDDADQVLVLLHELAHAITPWNVAHGREFWENAMALYARYGLDPKFVAEREAPYKAGAIHALYRHGYIDRHERDDFLLAVRMADASRGVDRVDARAMVNRMLAHKVRGTWALTKPKWEATLATRLANLKVAAERRMSSTVWYCGQCSWTGIGGEAALTKHTRDEHGW